MGNMFLKKSFHRKARRLSRFCRRDDMPFVRGKPFSDTYDVEAKEGHYFVLSDRSSYEFCMHADLLSRQMPGIKLRVGNRINVSNNQGWTRLACGLVIHVLLDLRQIRLSIQDEGKFDDEASKHGIWRCKWR